MQPQTSSQASLIKDQFIIRFPEGMRAKLKVIASENRRSMNAELLLLIEKGLAATDSHCTGVSA